MFCDIAASLLFLFSLSFFDDKCRDTNSNVSFLANVCGDDHCHENN